MSLAIATNYVSQLTTVETPSAFGVASGAAVNKTGINTTKSLDASTTPPVVKDVYLLKALVAGVGSLDLTAIIDAYLGAVDMSGLKAQFVKFKATLTNANPITIGKGASNGYGLDAAGTTWSITLDAGQEFLMFLNDKPVDVDGTHKTIDLAGTGTQSVEVAIVGG